MTPSAGLELARGVAAVSSSSDFVHEMRASAGERKVVILLDDFDVASSDLRAWLVESFIPSLANAAAVGVVVAGRFVPTDLEKQMPGLRVESIDRLSSFSRDDIGAFLKLNGVEARDDDISFFERQLEKGIGLEQLTTIVRAVAESAAP